MLRLHSILGSLPVLVIMPARAVAVAGESEKPKCEQTQKAGVNSFLPLKSFPRQPQT
jgi:hypothetical protein